MRSFLLIIGISAIAVFPLQASAVSVGNSFEFSVDAAYDASDRAKLDALFVRESPLLYVAVDKNWWDAQGSFRKSEILYRADLLAAEFERNIYPNLTSAFGSEWKPGVDNDPKITILVHPMKEGVGGYFREADERLKLEVPDSNEKEMVYLASGFIETDLAKSFLAHEFVHLITYNQKEKLRKVGEETWLNEARAEYALTFLGYANPFEQSNLKNRLGTFLQSPQDSLTEWKGGREDYGVLNLFIHYLVDQYGMGILIDSLQSDTVGVTSLNAALVKNGFPVELSRVFEEWALAVFLNNCEYERRFCYLQENLKDVRLVPFTNFLPLFGKSSLTVSSSAKSWSGNWLRFVGGQGVLTISFEGAKGLNWRVPYVVQTADGKHTISSLAFSQEGKGEAFIENFGTQNKALVVIPLLFAKQRGFNGEEQAYPFSLTVSLADRTPQEEQELMRSLLTQIDLLKSEIARLQAQLQGKSAGEAGLGCAAIRENLSPGMRGENVRCLQEFLKRQGSAVYPEGLVTGYFGPFTRSAVIRLQEKYGGEILAPLGLAKGTGVVGAMTRQKINKLLTLGL